VFKLLSGILQPIPGPYNCTYRNNQEVKDFILESIEKHRQMLDPSAPQDIVDSFLIGMDKARAMLNWEWMGKSLQDQS
jgi:hypothetical protein